MPRAAGRFYRESIIIMSLVPRLIYGLILSGLLVAFVGCKPEPVKPVSSESITKSDREKLGDKLTKLLHNRPIEYPILANEGQDTLVYQFVQTLYNQATAVIRLDLNSPASNRWNQEKNWLVHILDKDEVIDAFTLPAGNLFITTGFLKSIEREYELFYLLSFEANLINEKYLLNRMVSEYNTINLLNLIEGSVESNGISIGQVMKDATEYVFSASEVGKIDRETVPSICNTSVYRGDGISEIVSGEIENINFWLQKRMNYGGRVATVIDLGEAAGNCGSLRTTGAYREFVLDILD